MNVYHISPELGPRICKAEIKDCKYKTTTHFDNFKDAQVEYETQLSKQYSKISTLSKSKSVLNKKEETLSDKEDTLKSLLHKSGEDSGSTLAWVFNEELTNISKYSEEFQVVVLDRIIKSVESEIKITKDLLDTMPNDTVFSSLNQRLKSPASTARKIKLDAGHIKNPTIEHYKAVSDSLTDIVRYSFETKNHDALASVIKEHSDKMLKLGYVPKKAKNAYHEENSYKGFAVIWQNENGEAFELQYHSEESLAIKEESHTHYEIFRDNTQPTKNRKAAENECVKLYRKLKSPAFIENITKIGDLPVGQQVYQKL